MMKKHHQQHFSNVCTLSQEDKRLIRGQVMEPNVRHYPMLSLQLESYDHRVDLRKMEVIVQHLNRLYTMPKDKESINDNRSLVCTLTFSRSIVTRKPNLRNFASTSMST